MKKRKNRKIGWDATLQTYRELMKGEDLVGTIIVPSKPNFSRLYGEKK